MWVNQKIAVDLRIGNGPPTPGGQELVRPAFLSVDDCSSEMNGANQTSCSVHPPNAGEDERRLSDSLVHLVDDDDAVRTTLARLLVLSGYEVREYASGAELLDAADGLEGGCILLDLNMPEADGLAVHQALKDRSINIPVILMTGAGVLPDSPLDVGIAGVIQKPFRRAELMSLLDRIFAESHPAAKAP